MGQKTRKSKTNENKKSRLEPSVLTALITAVVTITVALLGFPPIIRYFAPEPTLTPSPTGTATSSPEPSATIFATQSLTPETIIIDTATFSPEPSATIFATQSLTPEATMIDTATSAPPTISSNVTDTKSPPIGMQVILTADQTDGKAPLIVKFNARDSYLRVADGTIYKCGACNYTWSIRQSSSSIFGPEKADGAFEYKFGKKGTYFVTVFVCRNSDNTECAGDGITVEVK